MSEWFSEKNLEKMPKKTWAKQDDHSIEHVLFRMSQRFVFTFWFPPGESQFPNVIHTPRRRGQVTHVQKWGAHPVIGFTTTQIVIGGLHIGVDLEEIHPLTWIHLGMTLMGQDG